MRYYVKVADAMMGIGFSEGRWTRKGAEKLAETLRPEFGDAVWVVTRRERRERLRS